MLYFSQQNFQNTKFSIELFHERLISFQSAPYRGAIYFPNWSLLADLFRDHDGITNFIERSASSRAHRFNRSSDAIAWNTPGRDNSALPARTIFRGWRSTRFYNP